MAIVVSHIASDFDRLGRQALRQAPLADVIELRLDRIGNPGLDKLRGFVQAAKKPVLVAVHGGEAHGDFRGDVDERLAILRAAAEAGARFVDVDWRLSLDLGEVAGKCHRIVSRHELEGLPEDPEACLEEVRDQLYEGDIIKLVPHAASAPDGLRCLRFLRRTGGGLIAFSSGEAGAFTRILAPIFGSPFTYAAPAHIPGEPEPEATAPGQLAVNDLRALLPPSGLTPETAIFGVVGRPISGSWSPRVHGMALKAAKFDAVYVPFEAESLEEFLDLADDENFRGFSVTAPFKEDALRLAKESDTATRAVGAANTLLRLGDAWRAANTDETAVGETLEGAFAIHARGEGRPSSLRLAHALVLGTGGAARAALRALRSREVLVTVAGRDADRARALGAEFSCAAIAWEEVPSVEYDVLIHATPVGSSAEPGRSPIPDDWIRPGTLVLDAVYNPLRTPLLEAAQKKGCTPVPGGEWFVRQAREQFRLFTHAEPDEPLMRAAFEHALADAGP